MAEERPESSFTHALHDLQRRRVFRAVVTYLIVAWLVAQVGDLVLPAFDAPRWALRALITLLVLGFPLVVALSWLFDVTPEGVRRSPAARVYRSLWFRMGLATPVVAATLGGIWWVWGDYLDGATLHVKGPLDPRGLPTIAVAELRNLTGDESLDWLGEGAANLLRNELAESRHLIVVSRTRWQSILRLQSAGIVGAEPAESRAGIDYVLSGEYLSGPSGLILTTRLSDIAGGADLVPQRFDNLTAETLLQTTARLASVAKQALKVPHTDAVHVFAADFFVDDVAAYESYLSGLEYFHRFSYEKAERAFRAALELQPRFHIARYRLAHVQWVTGRADDALASIEAIPADASLGPRERLYVDGARAVFARDYDGAKAIFGSLLEQYPFEIEAREFLAEVHWLNYEEDEALVQLKRLAEQEPENEAIWSYLGETYLDLGRLDDAQAALDRYLSLAPEDPFGLYVLGNLEQLRGAAEAAGGYYERALAREPTFRPAQLGLAQSYVLTGRQGEAELVLRDLISSDVAQPVYRIDAAFDLCALLRAEGRFADALTVLTPLEPIIAAEQIRESLALGTRGLTHMELGEWIEAQQLIALAIERAVGPPTRYLFARGMLELAQGQVEAARATAQEIRSYSLPPEDARGTAETAAAYKAAAYLQGLVLLAAGDAAAARAQLATAVEVEGYQYGIYKLGLAAALDALGERESAASLAAEAATERDAGDMRWDLELDRTRARLLEARIRSAMGQVSEAGRLAREFIARWQLAPPDHRDMVLARQLAGNG